MATSSQNFDLPRTAPNNDRHRNTSGESYAQPVYSIVPLDRSALENLVDQLNAAEDVRPGTCKLAPEPDFANRPLRDVYNYHLQLRDQDHSIHPLYFIVAADADFEKDGVIVVHLHTGQDDEEDRVDKARCSVDWAASWGINFDIGNMDWEDLKEQEEEEWGDRAMSWTPASQQPVPPDTEPPRFQYACFSLVEKAINLPQSLDPNWSSTPVEHRRVILGGNYSGEPDGRAKVAGVFPWFCKSHPETHRRVVILADKPDFEADGVLLLEFDWDGDVDSYDDDSINELNLGSKEIKRVPASTAVAELDAYCRENNLPLAYSP
ncbi:hypothetical protein GGS26DRAFT_577479 [Hypomontagnella submonticulosa]|nr:hypothetical protein GGS26DRAFT_577479 [Hypomontagnella submonticulosa]